MRNRGLQVSEVALTRILFFLAHIDKWAHGVVVSHPLRMRKALGSNPSVSRTNDSELCLSLCGWRSGLARVCQQQFHICRRQTYMWVHSSVARAADRRSAGPWLKSGCALIRSDRIATAPPPSLHSPPRPPSSRAQKYFPRSQRCDEAVRAYPLWDSNPQSLD